VVIVGGGFAGLYACKALRRSPVRVTLVDKRNHHLFQPLLYQVAMAGLSPGDIAQPLRGILQHQRNAEVVLGTVTDVDLAARKISIQAPHDRQSLQFDFLILATGATDTYFGHDEWRGLAPPLKTIEDALEIRRRFLLAFESAEYESDPDERAALLTFVVVGGGPTGVELAGTMAEIARHAVPEVYRHIADGSVRVILCEGHDRILAGMSAQSSRSAAASLRALGVDVRTSTLVTGMNDQGVTLANGNRIRAANVMWAAGVRANPLAERVAQQASAPCDRSGRVQVRPDCSLPNWPDVFIVGDAAQMHDATTNMQVPGMAQGAMQSGAFVARVIDRQVRGLNASAERTPFHYRDKGTMATIGRARAVAEVWGGKFSGLPAWLLWLGVHLIFLIGFRNKVMVVLQWGWAYLFYKAAAPLITGSQDGRAGELPRKQA
jgi:NADH dehydrogenase